MFLAVIAPIKFEMYSIALHSASWLKIAEFALFIIALGHISLSIIKVINNSKVGNTARLSSRRKDFLAVLASRFQPIGGIFLICFLSIHLKQLRFPRPIEGSEISTLRIILDSPTILILYLLGSISLFLHLFHGIESSQRSLGSLSSNNASLIRAIGRILSLLIGGGFIFVTIALSGIPFQGWLR